MSTPTGTILVDFDGTLAKHDDWQGPSHCGEPIPLMLARVKQWLAEGRTVKIFTARVGPQKDPNDAIRSREAIAAWCIKWLGRELPITATKDYSVVAIWDDRAVQVITNTGLRADGLPN